MTIPSASGVVLVFIIQRSLSIFIKKKLHSLESLYLFYRIVQRLLFFCQVFSHQEL